MKLTTIGIGFLLVFFLGACDKNELPDNFIGMPSFFAEGTVDGEPLFFSAGPENVIIESGYELSVNGLPIFSAAFSDSDCQLCSQSLFLEIIGTTEFQEGLSIPDYVPEGSYSLSNYQSGQGEPLFHFEFDNENVVGVILESNDGLVLFSDSEIPDMELPDGAYSLMTLYEDGPMGCFGTQNLLFHIEDGALCGSIPTIAITEEGMLTFTSNSDSENVLLVINDIPFLDAQPGIQIDLEELLDDFEMLESINIIDFSGSACPSNAIWSFDGVGDNYCIVSTSITQVEVELEHEPMTAIVKYTDENFNTYISSSTNSDQMEILSLEQILEENASSESYRCDFVLNTYLINSTDPEDSIHFVVSSASVPLGME